MTFKAIFITLYKRAPKIWSFQCNAIYAIPVRQKMTQITLHTSFKANLRHALLWLMLWCVEGSDNTVSNADINWTDTTVLWNVNHGIGSGD